MSVQVKGSGTIGGLDEGLVVSGIVTSSTQVNVGSNIKLGSAGVVTATSFVGSGANLTSLPAQLTLSNNADNRVITGGSGVNLNGEANLTFNGGATGDAQLTVHAEQNDSGADSELILETSNDFTTSVVMFKDSTAEAGSIAYNHGDNYIKLSTNGTNGGTERLRINSSGTTFSFSPDSTTPNIKWRSNDTNWFGSLNQSVGGSTISTILSTGGDWSASGTTYSATKAIASFPTGALVLHNQYNSDATGAQLVFLNKAGGSSTTDGTVSERLRIHSTGRTQVNLPSTSGSSSAISTAQAIVGTKHIHTVYHNFNSTNSGLAINSVIPTNSTGTVDIMGGWANGNGIIFKRFVWCASGDTAISQVFSTAASRYGVSVSISTPTMSISGDYVNFNFTFSDSQGSKMEKLKIHFEYHKQFYVI